MGPGKRINGTTVIQASMLGPQGYHPQQQQQMQHGWQSQQTGGGYQPGQMYQVLFF